MPCPRTASATATARSAGTTTEDAPLSWRCCAVMIQRLCSSVAPASSRRCTPSPCQWRTSASGLSSESLEASSVSVSSVTPCSVSMYANGSPTSMQTSFRRLGDLMVSPKISSADVELMGSPSM